MPADLTNSREAEAGRRSVTMTAGALAPSGGHKVRGGMLPVAFAVLIAFAYLITAISYSEHDNGGDEPWSAYPNGEFATMEYGWPVVFMRCTVDRYMQAGHLFAWATASHHVWLLPIGTVVCCAVLLTLSLSAAWTGFRLREKIPGFGRISLPTLIGLVTFASLELSSPFWRHVFTTPWLNDSEALDVVLIVYARKLTWFSVFLSCIAIPNVLARIAPRYLRRAKNREIA